MYETKENENVKLCLKHGIDHSSICLHLEICSEIIHLVRIAFISIPISIFHCVC